MLNKLDVEGSVSVLYYLFDVLFRYLRSFRLRSVRPLKNLMIMNQGGCGPTSPGIGDIAFVKDLRTENIVTTNFRCSKFGGYHHPLTSFGWVG